MKITFVAALVTILVSYCSAAPPVVCPPVNGHDVTLLPNPYDCKTYYSCNEGIPFLMTCYGGLEFNPRERVCDWPENARCEVKVPGNLNRPDSSVNSSRLGGPKEPSPNDGLGHPADLPNPNGRPIPGKPPHPKKPSCPAESPDDLESPHPGRPPHPSRAPRPTEPSDSAESSNSTEPSEPIPSPDSGKPPRPTESSQSAKPTRRPIWPPRLIWPIPNFPPRPTV